MRFETMTQYACSSEPALVHGVNFAEVNVAVEEDAQRLVAGLA